MKDPNRTDKETEEWSDDESGYATAEDDISNDDIQDLAPALKSLPEDGGKNAREKKIEPESLEALGVVNVDFFRPCPGPGPMRTNLSAGVRLPQILAQGIISINEVDELFTCYFEKMNISVSLLDPRLHTPQYVALQSPFLFTVVCSIASRFYDSRPGLYQQLMQYSQLAAGTALISGRKNEETVAAYILMQLYAVPAKRWDEERNWIYLGLAIRIAQDINLNRPIAAIPINERDARIILNRQRIWMNCFNLDRSAGTQYGKRPVISNMDYFAINSQDWWRSSPYNMKGFDIHICGYNAELRLISAFSSRIYGNPNHPLGLDETINVAQLAIDTDTALRQLRDYWFKRLDEFEEEKTAAWAFRTELLRMAYTYARLFVLSTGLKHTRDGQLDEETFIMRCFDATSDIVSSFVRRLFATPERKILLRHAPDAQFVFVTFASAFLVKLLSPKYSRCFTSEQREEIHALVEEVVHLLGAQEVSVDEKHGPKLYSRFLSCLLANQSANLAMPSPKNHSRQLSRVTSNKGQESARSSPSLSNLGGPAPESSSSGTSDSSFSLQKSPYADINTAGCLSSGVDSDLRPSAPDSGNQGLAMPMDQELLDSIQFLSDPIWQDTLMPGFSWVHQMKSTNGPILNPSDYPLHERSQCGTTF